jgi:hypothetical protein
MFNTIVGAGAASRYGSGSGSDQKMRLRIQLSNTDFNKCRFASVVTNYRLKKHLILWNAFTMSRVKMPTIVVRKDNFKH